MPISYQKREGKTVYFDNQIMVFHFPACLVLANGRPLCFVFFFPLLPGRVHKSKGRNLKKKCRRDHNRCCSCHSSLKSGCSMVFLWCCPWVVAVVQMNFSYGFLGSFIHHDMHVSIVVRCAHGPHHGDHDFFFSSLPLFFSLSLSLLTRNLHAIHLPTCVTIPVS